MKKKADGVDKLFNGIDPDDLLDELARLRDKAKAFDDLVKKLGGKDPGKNVNNIFKMTFLRT